jgi:type I restriction enzyme M protein
MTAPTSKYKNHKKELKDYYWAYSDILRDIGINESTYDQRIMAFMALKLLIDNDKLMFDFEYQNNFGLSDKLYTKYKGKDTKETFLNIVKDIENLGIEKNLPYFKQESKFNPDKSENILTYLNHYKTFELERYINELPNSYLENVLDIYTYQANFRDYPKEEYKDLYEKTVSRMKKLSGDLTGQHFTQKSIIHLICEMGIEGIKDSEKLAIYDPTSGTGSMLMESAEYFKTYTKVKEIELYGQEMHGQTWLLSKIFLEITNQFNIIAYGNTLTNPAFAHGINGRDSFDFIIANPPFGVDWKHNYDEIVENMKSEDSNFFVVKDEKNKIVTPKKSDGQFLFMMHIINLMKKEDERGKRAKAGIISSSTLISTGSSTSREAKIRKAIFGEQIVSAVLEQPSAMFTNTDITSHIWFLDTKATKKIKIVKADTKEEKLFITHPNGKDKMKHSYSKENIKKLKRYLTSKTDKKYISKSLSCDRYEINISQEIGFKDETEELSLDALEKELDELMKSMCEDYQKNGLWGF